MERERNRPTPTDVDPGKAREFFNWLVPQLGRILDDGEIQSLVGARLGRVSKRVKWEAGPWTDGGSFFAISPSMNIDVVPIAEQIVRFAPNVPGWVFLPAKPRKIWQRVFRLESKDGTQQTYDLSDWKYWLTGFNDGEFFDVNLVPGEAAVPDSELQWLGEFLVASELGEGVFLSHVGSVNLVPRKDAPNETSSIEVLHTQFTEQLEKHFRH